MSAGAVIGHEFPVARCAPCGRDVLTHVEVDAGGRERRRCIHCDAELDPAEVRWVAEDGLDGLGYGVHVERAGCGGGGGSCGSGGCGRRGA
jgi:hypothetical protein